MFSPDKYERVKYVQYVPKYLRNNLDSALNNLNQSVIDMKPTISLFQDRRR